MPEELNYDILILVLSTLISEILIVVNSAILVKGLLIYDRKKIIKKYFKTKFFVDCLTIFPFFFIFNNDQHWIRKLVYLLCFCRMIRVFELSNKLEEHFNF